ncbi:MAG: glycosyltransferase family 87 protein [Bacteroidota bacterium]
MSFLRRHSWIWISALGIVVRLMYALWLGEELLSGDAFYYVDTAKSILDGESYLPEWPPALPYYLSIFGAIFGQGLWSWVFGMLFLYLLFNWVWKETASLFLKKKWVNLGMIVFALMPAFVHYGVAPLSQLPLAIIILALVHLLYANRRGWKMGLLLSIGVLFRSGTLSLFPLFLVYLLSKKHPREFFPFFLSFLVLIGIWQYKSWQMTERFVWINDFNSYNLYVGNTPWTPDYKTWWLGSHDERKNEKFTAYYSELDSIRSLPIETQSKVFGSRTFFYIRKDFGRFLYRSGNRLRCFLAFDSYTGARVYQKNKLIGLVALLIDASIYVFWGCFALLSLVKIRRAIFEQKFLCVILGLMLCFALPYVLAFAHPTYHFPLIPLLALLALKGIKQSGIQVLIQEFKYSHILILGIFFLIQLEWMWHMSTAFS